MVDYTCQYCNHTFATKVIMLQHQKRTQYCLKIQGKDKNLYTCKCQKQYTTKSSLNRHKAKCPTVIAQQKPEMVKLMTMMKELQQQVSQLAANQKPQVGSNLKPITDKDLSQYLDSLSLDFIERGVKGYADYAGSYPFKDKVICTDRSRKKIKYKDQDGVLSDDGRALAQRFFQAISQKNSDIINKEYQSLQTKMQDIVATNNASNVDIAKILKRATFMQDMLIRTNNAAEGKDDDFAQDFLTYLSKLV